MHGAQSDSDEDDGSGSEEEESGSEEEEEEDSEEEAEGGSEQEAGGGSGLAAGLGPPVAGEGSGRHRHSDGCCSADGRCGRDRDSRSAEDDGAGDIEPAAAAAGCGSALPSVMAASEAAIYGLSSGGARRLPWLLAALQLAPPLPLFLSCTAPDAAPLSSRPARSLPLRRLGHRPLMPAGRSAAPLQQHRRVPPFPTPLTQGLSAASRTHHPRSPPPHTLTTLAACASSPVQQTACTCAWRWGSWTWMNTPWRSWRRRRYRQAPRCTTRESTPAAGCPPCLAEHVCLWAPLPAAACGLLLAPLPAALTRAPCPPVLHPSQLRRAGQCGAGQEVRLRIAPEPIHRRRAGQAGAAGGCQGTAGRGALAGAVQAAAGGEQRAGGGRGAV